MESKVKNEVKTIDQNDPEEDEHDDDESDDEFEGVPITEDSDGKMLFIYQSEQMKRIYRRYGKDLVLLDATYKTTKYSLPLYFLVVKTNVNYQVCSGFFILSFFILQHS